MPDARTEVRLVPARHGANRRLAVEEAGAQCGLPVFLMHGTPGSRTGPRPRSSFLYRLGVRLISYDRPGYGGSTRLPGRTVADAATDVETIADYLGLDKFAVVGRSGGGPHALACAARLGDRVVATAALVSIAPPDAPGLEWFDGMAAANVEDYDIADRDAPLFRARIAVRADGIRRDPESLVKTLRTGLPQTDLRVLDDRAMRGLLTDTYAEAVRPGADGWIDDAYAFRNDWGFRLDEIKGDVRLWHGADDTFSPVSHTLWLARQITHARVQIQADTAHFGAVEALPRMLRALADECRHLVATDSPRSAPAD